MLAIKDFPIELKEIDIIMLPHDSPPDRVLAKPGGIRPPPLTTVVPGLIYDLIP